MAGVGAFAAAAVGYVVSKNPGATPAHLGATARVLIIATFVLAGLYAQTIAIQARIGLLLVAAGLCASLWLLNGSSDPFLFSVGVLFTGATPVFAAYLLLAHPTGRLRSRGEQRFLWLMGGSLAALWVLGVLMTTQPPLKTPLLQCGPHCPSNVFSLGSAPYLVGVVRAAMVTAWVALTCGTAWLLAARMRSASRPMRRSLTPVLLTGSALAVVLVCYLALEAAGVRPSTAMGAAYVAVAVAIPLAILVGLGTERMFMAGALAEFLGRLARDPGADPQIIMAAALRDPSLRVCYARTRRGTYVDSAGEQLTDVPVDRAVTWIERDDEPVAAVVYSADLADQERFVQAAGAAALIRLEKAQVEADLKASTADLAASRVRLVETAHAERRRLERDLHDGVQQRMVGLRLKLELAAEALKDDPAEAQRALAWIGDQMDDVLHELRSFARGIYPSLLAERGLREAIKAAARNSPIPVEVRASGLERYSQDVEIAVYFCCMEAIQNAVKHGGPNATATVMLWPDGPRLCFAVDNPGPGFDANQVRAGSGLVNMRDRIEAVGGTLQIRSGKGRGVAVRGSVPSA
ncbi:MAG TPA: sensor histidine kinase [Solirubrobacteraceae bacterium]|nr:sensor histidine kinase [Solirubrobacteraceae bacterium]